MVCYATRSDKALASLLRLCQDAIKALLRLYSEIKALSRLYQGAL